MRKDAQNEDLELTPAAKAKFDELVAMLLHHGQHECHHNATNPSRTGKLGKKERGRNSPMA